MFELSLGFENRVLYRGCDVREYEPGKYRLVTPLDSAVVIVAQNLQEILNAVSSADRDVLVLTGAAPQAIVSTAQSVIGPYFDAIELFDGKRKIRTRIPKPPERSGEPE